MALEICPQCNRKLGAPLKSSGRQVCMKCGWSDRPRQVSQPTTEKAPELSFVDIQKLLGKAAEESKENMKPKYKRGNQVKDEG